MKIRSIIYTLICCVFAVSCSNISLSDIEDRVSRLEEKVKVLEAQLKGLNDNIDALKVIANEGTINSVTESNGVYTITCSNGDILTINQGSVGVGNAPVLSIDEDGYWMADYGDGPVHILSGDNKVIALGQNGLTPVFGIDAEGYWTIKTGDAAPEQVKGADGKPVSALPDANAAGEKFFEDVNYDTASEKFTLTLKNGDTYTVPVVSGFMCYIEGGEGPQIYKPGERRVYSVALSGIAQTFITTPKDWDAFLSETSEENKGALTVIAPVQTKSTPSFSADSRKDISILAISNQGYATVAKLSVQMEGGEIDIKPMASVQAVGSEIETMEFSVIISEATSYKYIIQQADLEAPSADKIAAEGVDGSSGSSLIINGLTGDTQYTLYVMPMNGDIRGEITSVSQTTKSAPVTDLYDAYQNKNKEIEINGIRYSKAVHGNATLVTAESAEDPGLYNAIKNATGGVFFVDTPEETAFILNSAATINGCQIIIGRHTTHPARVKQTSSGYIQTKGSLVVKNIRFIAAEKYLAVILTDSDMIHFDGCWFDDIQKPIIYAASKEDYYGAAVSSISITNSVIKRIGASVTNVAICNIGHTTSLERYDEFRFDNNVVYCPDNAVIQLFTHSNKTTNANGWNDNTISVCNNIFYNVPGHTDGFIKYHLVSELKCNNNIFIASGSHAAHWNITYCFNEEQKENPDAIDISGNICYGLSDDYGFRCGHTSGKFYPSANTLTKNAEDPFKEFDTEDGSYELKSAYVGYGPKTL